jgi:hypothetical protein
MAGRYAVMLVPTPDFARVIVADMEGGEVWAQVDGPVLLDAMAAGKGCWLADMADVNIKLPYPEALVCMAPASWLRDFYPPEQRDGFDDFMAKCIRTAREGAGMTLQ